MVQEPRPEGPQGGVAMTDYWKTTITITVLSEGKTDFDNNLDVIRHAITGCECSGKVEVTTEEKLTVEELRQECVGQGTDPEFFLWWEA